ncbi:MAG: type 4a pilus biogenesis protein PilO [Bdellovibrionota bacterium]
MMEALNKQLSKVPVVLGVLFYLLYLGYSHWSWRESPESEFGTKKSVLSNAVENLGVQKKKLADGEEFFKNLDAVRARIRQLTAQLDGTKASLSADIDIANFVRMVTLEAKKLGLSIKGIKPEPETKKDCNIEVPFSVAFRGAYVQALVFFDRIAKFQQVIRVSDFEMKPTGSTYTKYVELDAMAKLVAYKYLGSQADDIINKQEMSTNVMPTSGTAAPVTPTGGAQ